MNVLVLNAGSSTLKFELIRTDLERIERDADQRIARGEIQAVGHRVVHGGERFRRSVLRELMEEQAEHRDRRDRAERARRAGADPGRAGLGRPGAGSGGEPEHGRAARGAHQRD